jgi:hypothetical protein
MWPWGRKSELAHAPATLPVSRAEWRTLPPIQRITLEHPVVNPVQRFSDSLASWQNPSYLQPLGHRIGAAEPAGVADLAAPVTAQRSAVATPLARPPRRGTWSRLWGAVAQRSARPSELESPVATATSLPPSDETPTASHDHLATDTEPPPTIAVDPSGDEVLPVPVAALAGTQPSAVGTTAMPDTRPVQRMVEPTLALPAPHREPVSPAAGTAEATAQHVATGDEPTTVQPSPTVQPTPAAQPVPTVQPSPTAQLTPAVRPIPTVQPSPMVEPPMVERTAAAQPVETVRSTPAALPIVAAVQQISAAETTPAVRTIAAGPPDDGGGVSSTGRTDAGAPTELPLAATEVTPRPAPSVQRATDSTAVRSIVPPTPGQPPAGETAQPLSPVGLSDLMVASVDLPVFRPPVVAAAEPPATTIPAETAVSGVDTVPTVSAPATVQRAESGPLPDRSMSTPGPVVQRTDSPPVRPLSPQRLGLGAPIVPERSTGTELHQHGTAGPIGAVLSPSLQRTPDLDAPTTPPAPDPATTPADTGQTTVLPTLGAPPEPSLAAVPTSPPSRPMATEPAPVVMRITEPATAIAVPPPVPVLGAGHTPGEPAGGQPEPAAARRAMTELPVSRLLGDADPLTRNHSADGIGPLGQFGSGPTVVSRVHATSHGSPTADTEVPRTTDLPPVPLAIQRTDYYGTAPSPVVAQPRPAPVNRMPPSPEAPTFSVMVQRDDAAPAQAPEPVATPDPGPAPSPPPASAGTPGSASPAAAPAPGMAPEELVKKLFDPLLRRLKTELRFDRERRGRLTDLSQ